MKGKRIIGLDLLRIGLALLIFLFHSNMHFQCDYGWLDNFVKAGALAMTGFFMLSGYSLEISQKQINTFDDYKRYLKKRCFSLFPLYYFVLFAYLFVWSPEPFLDKLFLLPVELLGLQSFFSSLFSFSHNGGTWFISCLVICYFVFPFVRWILDNVARKKLLLFFMASICVLSPFISHHFSLTTIYANPFFRCLEFCSGILIAKINTKESLPSWCMTVIQKKWMPLLTVIIMIITVSYTRILVHPADYMMYNYIVFPGFVILLFSLGYINYPLFEKSRLTALLSTISYAFYMSQFFCWTICIVMLKYVIVIDNNVIRVVLAFVICSIIALGLYYIIEKPVKKYLVNKYIS